MAAHVRVLATGIVRRHVKQLLDDFSALDPHLLRPTEMAALMALAENVLNRVLEGKRSSATPLQQSATRNLERMVNELDRTLPVDLRPDLMRDLVAQSFETQFQQRLADV